MRLSCPACGERDVAEFSYLGDAALAERPDPEAADVSERFHAYVYLRDNPAGVHRELWYHGAGCRSWLVVNRDLHTHEIIGSALAGRRAAEAAP